jgi:K+-sensing histidine kinase KdpD
MQQNEFIKNSESYKEEKMFILDMLFALAIALLLTGLFAMLFRGMRMGNGLLFFLLILFLATWSGGLWIGPFGPTLLNVFWLPFLLVGLLISLLMVIFITPVSPQQPLDETRMQTSPNAPAVIVIDALFWILILGLLVTLVVAYL